MPYPWENSLLEQFFLPKCTVLESFFFRDAGKKWTILVGGKALDFPNENLSFFFHKRGKNGTLNQENMFLIFLSASHWNYRIQFNHSQISWRFLDGSVLAPSRSLACPRIQRFPQFSVVKLSRRSQRCCHPGASRSVWLSKAQPAHIHGCLLVFPAQSFTFLFVALFQNWLPNSIWPFDPRRTYAFRLESCQDKVSQKVIRGIEGGG